MTTVATMLDADPARSPMDTRLHADTVEALREAARVTRQCAHACLSHEGAAMRRCISLDLDVADLTDATFGSGDFSYNDFTGATTTGITAHSGPWQTQWIGTDFGVGGWAGSTWSGSHNFTDAHCPDGTVGSWANPCFVIPSP